MRSIRNTKEYWEAQYRSGQLGARYPFDTVVGFVLRRYSEKDRGQTKVLDFGCGVGNHISFLMESGFDVYGVESSLTAVDLARKSVTDQDHGWPEDHILHSTNNNIPFTDGYFDLVLDRSSLGQNRAINIPEIISEIYRVLKPGGVYFGINFSDHHPDLFLGKSLSKGDFGEFDAGKFKGLGSRHFFSVTEVRELFSAFDIEDIRLLRNESLYAKGGSEELIITAIKKLFQNQP